MANIYASVGDASKTIAVQLVDDDGSFPNLVGESITMRMESIPAGDVQTVTGLLGDATGNVSTVVPGAKLLEGTWALDWRVVDGLTYPGQRAARHLLIIRPEVS